MQRQRRKPRDASPTHHNSNKRVHKEEIQQQFANMIAEGRKTVEGRIWNDLWNVGDILDLGIVQREIKAKFY